MKHIYVFILFAIAGVAGIVWAADVDPLAELASLGDQMAATVVESGGSLRAKRDADPALAMRLKDPRNAEARVEAVQVGSFPLVALKVKVLNVPTGASVAKGDIVIAVPKLKYDKSSLVMQDDATKINMGSYYLHEGDRVALRLGSKKGKVYEAEYIERK